MVSDCLTMTEVMTSIERVCRRWNLACRQIRYRVVSFRHHNQAISNSVVGQIQRRLRQTELLDMRGWVSWG